MTKRPKTFITDLQWFKRCSKKLHDEIEENKDSAAKVVAFLDANPEMRRDLMGFYIKAKERLERED